MKSELLLEIEIGPNANSTRFLDIKYHVLVNTESVSFIIGQDQCT